MDMIISGISRLLKMVPNSKIWCFPVFLILMCCTMDLGGQDIDYSGTGYDLQTPDRRMKLHYDLREISGLTYLETGEIGCVQDESGRLFIYDMEGEQISRTIKFAKGGDYEGVELSGNTVWVSKSNGTLYSFPFGEAEEITAAEIKTPFTGKNDVEGLGYDPLSQDLIIACKASPEVKNNDADGKALYRFSLSTQKVDKKPWMELKRKAIKKLIEEKGVKVSKDYSLGPSGIARHPLTGNFYIVANVGKVLVIVDPAGEVIDAWPLNPVVFRQPEGITFAPDGTMFISNEGKGSRGNILMFKFTNPQGP